MKVGSLVFSTDQGLGILAKSFYDAGVVTDVMVVAHGRRPEHQEWYPSAYRINDLRTGGTHDRIRTWLKTLDCFLAFETPFIWEIFDWCRQLGVKSVLMPMHECMPTILPGIPDLFLCPSLLDYRVYCEDKEAFEKGVVYLPIPVQVPWRQRTKAEVFIHNAGNGGLNGRNGTAELIEASKLLKSKAEVIIYSQEQMGFIGGVDRHSKVGGSSLEFRIGTRPYGAVWWDGGEGDVFVFPEKFNGLSLPLQEAYAAGMLVMCGNRFPMNTWLPNQPLIPMSGYKISRTAPRCREFMEAIMLPQDIAATIDAWYGKDITEYSEGGREWAKTMSWEALKLKYMEALAR